MTVVTPDAQTPSLTLSAEDTMRADLRAAYPDLPWPA